MDPSVTAAIGPAVNAGTAIVATSGNNILISVPSGDGLKYHYLRSNSCSNKWTKSIIAGYFN